MGCAVGLEVINIFDNDGLIQQSFNKGQYFKDQLIKLQSKHKTAIMDIRARGLMLALEFNSFINAESVYLQLIDNGLLVGQKENILRFMPPLIIEESQIDKLINTIDKIITGT